MIPFDSEALDQLWQTLGLGRSGNVQTPQLEDGSLVMTVPILPDIARRSAGLLGTGWRFGILRARLEGTTPVLTAAATIDPYEPGTAIANYPTPVPQNLDVWLHSAALRLATGGGAVSSDLDVAFLSLDPVGNQQAWGEDDGGGGVVANAAIPLARWDAGQSNRGITESGDVSVRPNVRIPRGATLEFAATQSALAGGETLNVDCYIILGTFPASLGSDAQK